MKLHIIKVGKTRSPYWQKAERDFCDRVRRYARLEMKTVKDAVLSASNGAQTVRQTEARRILSQISAGEFVVALDRSGKQMDSLAFARFLESRMQDATKTVVFVVGGPLGLAEEVLVRADRTLSLSRMTFPHEMACVVLLEQIYRAFSILRGEKYHK
ncbi:MAG: 23S rRNA (pseudouridine(1915)-N(3))-methyltransferase RlmH [Calditrichaeota bacterium]|nr:MAG: 23S rRNA (pseudouridine(1915)-N(3))-methyltransferase RlmH [Calditrichota bacterium]